MDIKEIQNLIKFVAKSGASEVKLEMDDIKITIRTEAAGSGIETTYVQQIPMGQNQMAPMQAAPATEAPATEAAPAKADENSKYITIKSPIIGTFYRKPSPDKPVFVEVVSAR